MKKTYVWNSELNEFIELRARDKKNTHSVIQDSMNPLVHPCTGEMIDSKSKFREITDKHGCIELGNEKIEPSSINKPIRPKGVRDDLERVAFELQMSGKFYTNKTLAEQLQEQENRRTRK